MAVIEFDAVHKEFDSVTALDGIDLTVPDGEVFGFLGPNGAGKSTAINHLLGFVSPTSGRVQVFGRNPRDDPIPIRDRIGVLPEQAAVYERLTGRQHVEFAIRSKDVDADADDLLERVGIDDAADRRADDYSTGMRQRLCLAMALAGDPDLLILDEPTTGLDPNGARALRRLLRAENERGTTIFFSSHVLTQVEAVCDRVAILQDGRIVADNTVDALRDSLGADSRLVVTVGSDDEVTTATNQLVDVDGVGDVTVEGTDVVATLRQEAKLPALRAVDRSGIEITDFQTEQASLEDLFETVTEGGAA